jgi:predicted secreted protein
MRQVFGTRFIDYLPALGLLAISVLYLATAYTYDANARELPVAYGWVMLALLVLDLVSRTSTQAGHALLNFLNPAAEGADTERYPMARQLSAIFWVLLFTAMLVFIGVLYAVPIYVFASMRFHGKRSLWTALLSAVLTTAFIYALFQLGLRVELYPGRLFAEY